MQGLLIVHGDLFAGRDIAEREEQHVSKESAHVRVRLAGVVDVVCAVAATAAIDAPHAVDITDAQLSSMGAALSLAIRNSLAHVFSDFAPPRKMNGRKTASAVN